MKTFLWVGKRKVYTKHGEFNGAGRVLTSTESLTEQGERGGITRVFYGGRWKDAGVDGGDYTMYFSNVRDWDVDSQPLPKLLGLYIEAESHQKKILSIF